MSLDELAEAIRRTEEMDDEEAEQYLAELTTTKEK